MKILDFLQEDNGRFSSARLFAFMVTFGTMIDWMYAVFTVGKWSPDWQTISMVLGVLGFKFAQKSFEQNKLN